MVETVAFCAFGSVARDAPNIGDGPLGKRERSIYRSLTSGDGRYDDPIRPCVGGERDW